MAFSDIGLIQMEHLHTAVMIFLFLIIGLIALKVQLGMPKSNKNEEERKID